MPLYCTHCGSELLPEALFCGNCGASQPPPATVSSTAEPAAGTPTPRTSPTAPPPAADGLWQSGGRGLPIRLAAYAVVALLAVAAIVAAAAANTPTVPVVPTALATAAHRNSAARLDERRRELQAQNAAVCSSTFKPFLTSLKNLDTDLDVGLAFSAYSSEVTGANRKHAAAVNHVGDVTPSCLSNVGVPAENALNAYIAAYNTWNDCIGNLSCSNSSITPKLQADWAKADGLITKAQRALSKIENPPGSTI